MSACPRCARYREERDRAVEEARQLRALALGEDAVSALMFWLDLTPTLARVAAVLLRRDIATREALMIALYSDDPNGGAEPQILQVLIYQLRRRLARRGVTVDNRRGVGWALSSAMKERLKAAIGPPPRGGGAGCIGEARL